MQIVNSNAVDRDNLVAIFFFDAGDAPAHMMNGDRWWVAASAIGKNSGDKDWNDWENNFFVGFNTLVGAKVAVVPEQFNSELQSLVEEWVPHYNYKVSRDNFGASLADEAEEIDLARTKLHYTKFYDKKRSCTWGLAYLLR